VIGSVVFLARISLSQAGFNSGVVGRHFTSGEFLGQFGTIGLRRIVHFVPRSSEYRSRFEPDVSTESEEEPAEDKLRTSWRYWPQRGKIRISTAHDIQVSML